MKSDIVKRANRMTLNYLTGNVSAQTITIHGYRLVGFQRNIFKRKLEFIFDNGWLIEADDEYVIVDDLIVDLTKEIERRIGLGASSKMGSHGAPETMVDENPDELDPNPEFICQECQGFYR